MINLSSDHLFIQRIVGMVILAVLAFACLKIMAPFIGPLLWAIIITVSTWPLFVRLRTALGERRKLAATLMALVLACLFVVPIVMLVNSLSESVAGVVTLLRDLTSLKLGEPPTWLADIPLLGKRLDAEWHQAMVNMPATLEQARPYIEQTATWILKQAATFGTALLEFLLAVIISGFLYAGGETLAQATQRFALRTAGERGLTLVDVAERTIRSVAQGVIGTALIQALLIEFNLIMAGVPGSVLLGFLTFLLAVMQLPTLFVWVPVAVWLGYEDQMGWAIFTAVWGFFVVGAVDNFLRPYFISQGSQLPLLLIFAGVLGGLLAWGLIGIFLGATLLAVGYTLLYDWLYEELPPAKAPSEAVPAAPQQQAPV
ncbi:MAG: AI-2E family transporter [Candidatus Competibacteraceae bacterium]